MIRKFVTPLLAAGGLGLAAFLAFQRSQAEPPSAHPPVEPAQSPFPTFVAAPGLIEASTENIAIGSPLAGVVKKIYVTAGDPVKAGDPLFELDDRALRAQLITQRASLAVSEARVRTALASLEDTRQQLAFAEGITDKRAISAEVLSSRRSAVAINEARLAEADGDSAATRAQIEATEIERDRLMIRSPVDGLVLQVKTRVGEFATAGVLDTPLIMVGNVEQLHVRVDIDEDNAWRVRDGAAAVAHLRGNKEIETPLQFVRFEPYVVPKRSLTGASTERVDTRVLQIIYRFERGALPIFVGQQMEVFIDAPPHSSAVAANGKQP